MSLDLTPLSRAVDGVVDLLEQVLVGGLARPDVDVPQDLDEAAARLRALRMPHGADRLDALAAAVRAIGEVPEMDAAWAALQAAVAWARLARREVALARVQAQLDTEAAIAHGARPAPPKRLTVTVDVWPVGVELEGRTLTIEGRTVPDGLPVVVRDRIDLTDASAPLSGRAISRLFQAAVDLRRTLQGLLRFTDHPARRSGRGWALAPAFEQVPERRPVSADFVGPGPIPEPVRVVASDLAWFAGETPLVDAGLPAALNAAKLLLRGDDTVRGVVVRGRDEARLQCVHEVDGRRVWPGLDPGAIRLEAAHLAERLGAGASGGTAALDLHAALAALDGVPAESVIAAVEAAEAETVLDAYRLARARATLGLGRRAPALASAIRQLMEPRRPMSARARWAVCALAADWPEACEAPAMQVFPACFGPVPPDPGPLEVAARATALWTLGCLDAAAEAAMLGEDDDGAADEGAGVRAWFEAHLAALLDTPLTALERLALAETAARLDVPLAPVEAATLLATALPALRGLDGTPESTELAADGLHLLRRTGAAALLIDPGRGEDFGGFVGGQAQRS